MNRKEVRELFWPLLDPLPDRKPVAVTPQEVNVTKEEDLDKFCELAVKYYEEEDERKNSVEGKSTIFVSSIGFTTAILLSVTKDLVLNPSTDFPIVGILYLFILVSIVIYFARAVWFAIKGLERRGYHSLGYKDIINQSNDEDYKLSLAIKLINFTLKNHLIVNVKVDYMVMAHEYFKRAIVAIVIYSVTLAITSSITRYIKYTNDDDRVIKILSSINCGTWLLLACLFAFCLNLAYLYKINKSTCSPQSKGE